MTHKPIDFKTVEELRKHMLIPTIDWVNVLGTSRMTYYKWVNGKAKARPAREADIRLKIRKIFVVMASGWPSPEIAGLDPRARVSRLLAQMEQSQ